MGNPWGDALARAEAKELARADPAININQWASFFNYGGSTYPFMVNQSLVGNKEKIEHSFMAYANSLYRSNGVVFAVEGVRMRLFSEARFQYQQMRNGKPGKLFGTGDLELLEQPWPGGTTRDLLARAMQDVDIGGNFYAVVCDSEGVPISNPASRGPAAQIKRLRPDWTVILMGSPQELDTDGQNYDFGAIDTEIIAYLYRPEGGNGGAKMQTLHVEDVIHWAPIPDPVATYRGMSWMTPIMRETMADSAATNHKLAFFENGATPNMVVSMDPALTKTAFEEWIKVFRHEHEGVQNAYRTMYLAGGAVPTVIGKDLKQMDFATVQGHDETRIAAAAGVPPIIVGLSEGLEAATYSNYGQARRALADALLWPLWGSFADTVGQVIIPPGGARLWIDASGIAFLREDAADIANILYVKSEAINKLFMSGFDPDSIVDAIEANDLTQLVHTGLPSVQLQPGAIAPLPSIAPPNALPAPANGSLPATGPALIAKPSTNGKEASKRLLTPWLEHRGETD